MRGGDALEYFGITAYVATAEEPAGLCLFVDNGAEDGLSVTIYTFGGAIAGVGVTDSAGESVATAGLLPQAYWS